MEDHSNVVDHSAIDPAFAESIRKLAESDAVAVAEFLQERGLKPPTGDTCYSAEALLGIALSLRFRRWELHLIRVHIDAGLPTSDEVFEKVTTLSCGTNLETFVHCNWMQTIQLYHENFLWSANDCDLAVDIAIVAEEDEAFLDQIADFLIKYATRKVADDERNKPNQEVGSGT